MYNFQEIFCIIYRKFLGKFSNNFLDKIPQTVVIYGEFLKNYFDRFLSVATRLE